MNQYEATKQRIEQLKANVFNEEHSINRSQDYIDDCTMTIESLEKSLASMTLEGIIKNV